MELEVANLGDVRNRELLRVDVTAVTDELQEEVRELTNGLPSYHPTPCFMLPTYRTSDEVREFNSRLASQPLTPYSQPHSLLPTSYLSSYLCPTPMPYSHAGLARLG